MTREWKPLLPEDAESDDVTLQESEGSTADQARYFEQIGFIKYIEYIKWISFISFMNYISFIFYNNYISFMILASARCAAAGILCILYRFLPLHCKNTHLSSLTFTCIMIPVLTLSPHSTHLLLQKHHLRSLN